MLGAPVAAVEHIRLCYLVVFYSLNEMLAFVKMFPANGGGGMGVRMSLSEFQNRSFRALRRKPCPCRYFSCLCPYLSHSFEYVTNEPQRTSAGRLR